MSNFLTIANNVERYLDDLKANFYTKDDDIYPSIQDGYNLLVALTESIESVADVPFVDDLVFYDFTSSIPNYLRIFGIYNNNTNRWMFPTTMLELYKIRDNWELANDEPYWFVPIDYRTVALFPSKVNAVGTMTVLYKAKADIITANTEPQLPLEHHNSLEYYATEDMLAEAQEFTKAIEYMKLTNTSIDNIRKILRERSSPNHLYYSHDTF